MTITINDDTTTTDETTVEDITTLDLHTISAHMRLYHNKRMNPEVKQEWCTLLRSGRFPQTRGHLHDADGYCCLGVLSEIAKRRGFVDEVHYDGYSRVYRYDGEVNFPSQTVWFGFAGLDERDPTVCYGGQTTTLSCLNDAGVPFSTIASIIQEQL